MKFSLIIAKLAREILGLFDLFPTIFNTIRSIMLNNVMMPIVSNQHEKFGILFSHGKRVVRRTEVDGWQGCVITFTVNPP